MGTARIGRPLVSATAFAVPTVEPPPIASRRSTSASSARARAIVATSIGTCGRTPVNRTAIRSARGASTPAWRACSRWVAMTMTRWPPSRSTSSPSPVIASPAPKITRGGSCGAMSPTQTPLSSCSVLVSPHSAHPSHMSNTHLRHELYVLSMDLRRLSYFVVVAEERSISRGPDACISRSRRSARSCARSNGNSASRCSPGTGAASS